MGCVFVYVLCTADLLAEPSAIVDVDVCCDPYHPRHDCLPFSLSFPTSNTPTCSNAVKSTMKRKCIGFQQRFNLTLPISACSDRRKAMSGFWKALVKFYRKSAT
eukprot:scaffold13988_cov178-Skeletonema_dohrnii-CCMP3373.AAC.1